MEQGVGSLVAGRFEVQSLLGQGGFGHVYRALDRFTQQEVALKIFFQTSQRVLQQARREAFLLSRLQLGGVVHLVEDGVAYEGEEKLHGRFYIAMEMAPGRPFPGCGVTSWEQLRAPALQLLSHLEGLHRAGLVHRDLKPDNVLVTEEGQVTLLDLGVCWDPVFSSRERQDAVCGTLCYMAPEQLQQNLVDGRADLYAVALMLYECLAGHHPYPAQSHWALMMSRMQGAPRPLLEVAPQVEPHVAAAVDQALAMDPKDRPPSAHHFSRLLQGGLDQTEAELPWLGSRAWLEEIDFTSTRPGVVYLQGPPGSGKSRALREVEGVARAQSRRCLWVTPERAAAWDSLSEQPDLLTLAREGVVLLVDDLEALSEPWRDKVTLCRFYTQVYCATGRIREHGVRLKPLEAIDCRLLFHAPQRVLRIPELCAELLVQRTGGHPAAIAEVLRQWKSSNLLRAAEGGFVLSLEDLQQLQSQHPLIYTLQLPTQVAANLRGLNRDFLVAMVVLWPCATPALLATVCRVSTEVAHLVCGELVERRLATQIQGGHYQAVYAELPGERWTSEQLHRAYQLLLRESAPGEPWRFMALLVTQQETRAWDEVLISLRLLSQRGELSQGAQLAAHALQTFVGNRHIEGKELQPFFYLWFELALLQNSFDAISLFLAHLERTPWQAWGLQEVRSLAVALRLHWRGDARRTLEILDGVSLQDVRLESFRRYLRVSACHKLTPEAHTGAFRYLEEWARLHPSEPTCRRHLHNARASWYRHSRKFRLALEASLACLEEAPEHLAIPYYVSALSLAVADAALSDSLLSRMEEAASRTHNTYGLAQVAYRRRMWCYAWSRPVNSDPELSSILQGLGLPRLELLHNTLEAALAWRAGEWERGRALALEVAHLYAQRQQLRLRKMLHALARCCGADVEVELIPVEEMLANYPETWLQILGLLLLHGEPVQEQARAVLEAERETWEGDWGRRGMILSPQEIEDALGQGSGFPIGA